LGLSMRQVVEVISVIVVVLSLLFVAYQIRQSNDIAIAANENEVRNNYATFNEAIMLDTYLAELIYKSEDPSFVIEGRDRVIIENYIARALNSWRPVITSYERGLLDQISYDAAFDDMRFLIETYPAMRPLWRDFMGDYPSRSDDPIFTYIARLLEEN